MNTHIFWRVLPSIFAIFATLLFMHLVEVTIFTSALTFGSSQSFAELCAEGLMYIVSFVGLEKLFRKQLKKVFIENFCSYTIDYYIKFKKHEI